MGIVRKFAVALGSMLALILFVAAVGFVSLHVLEKKAGEIVVYSMDVQRLVLEVDSKLQLARQAERDFIQRFRDLGVDGARTVYATEFVERISEAERNVTWLQEMKHSSQDKADTEKSLVRLVELRQVLEAYSEHFRQLVEMAAWNNVKVRKFEQKASELDDEYTQLTSRVRQLATSATDGARKAHEGIAQSSMLVKYVLVLSVLFALLLAASIIRVLNWTVAKSVVRLSDAATELSLGNLEARVDVDSEDEFGQLADSINSMAERITTLINELEGQAAAASDRLIDAIDAISEGFLLYDRNGRLLLANRRINEVAGENNSYLKPGVSAFELLRGYAESGVFVNSIGREQEWIEDRLREHDNPGVPKEEPISDGRWMQFKTYRTSRGEVVVLMSDVSEQKRNDMHLASMNSDLEELVRERTKVLAGKAMELKLANERLMELDQLKSTFLSSVSHELRTPLTSLLGFSKIIKRDFMRAFMPLAKEDEALRLGSRIQGNLDIIGSEGDRLTRLINDVLDLSRIESGCDDWRFTEVDMVEVVNRAMASFRGQLLFKPEVKLSSRRFGQVPFVLTDADRMHQVLTNLLSNAVKFTDQGEVSIDLYQDAHGMIRLIVEDTGKGIDPRFIDRIFDKFHQAQTGDTLVAKPAGTGLGLAICRQIIEHYGGRIWAESLPGCGTRMCVVLPSAEPFDRPLILVVDDDPAVRDYLSLILKKAGYGVRTACNGREALDLVSKRLPALITMDILMPEMDGPTAIRTLRENSEYASIPVLVVSVVKDCHTAGGDAAFLKPIIGDAFLDVVHGLLGNGVSTRPMLVVQEDHEGASPGVAPVYCGDATNCSELEMWKRLGNGFEGTVLVPKEMADGIDLSRFCEFAQVQVLLLPGNSSGEPL
ncbi:MAG: response regulator [Pseudodesulfovibrio sp.]|nr:response regulator [Pseudodesulfovibrio sp.]